MNQRPWMKFTSQDGAYSVLGLLGNGLRLLCLVGGLVASPLSATAAIEHDNEVDFLSDQRKRCYPSPCDPDQPSPNQAYDGWPVQSIVFYWSGYSNITSGQPWGGISVDNTSVYWNNYPDNTVHVSAGRKGSAGPADFFNAKAKSPSVCTVGECGTTLIDAANFAFTGTLEIEGTDYQVVVGQFHPTNVSNAWILAGAEPGFTLWGPGPGQNPAYSLVTPDGKYYITALPGQAWFVISTKPCQQVTSSSWACYGY